MRGGGVGNNIGVENVLQRKYFVLEWVRGWGQGRVDRGKCFLASTPWIQIWVVEGVGGE